MGSRKQPRPTAADTGQVHGKRILVTGARSGIGAATVELLAAEGAAVGVHYHRKKAEAQKLIEKIRAAGGKAEGYEADLLSRDARSRLVPGHRASRGARRVGQQCRRCGWAGTVPGIGRDGLEPDVSA